MSVKTPYHKLYEAYLKGKSVSLTKKEILILMRDDAIEKVGKRDYNEYYSPSQEDEFD